MRKIFTCSLFPFLLASCGTRVGFVGTEHTPTTHVDVYISRPAVTKPYEIIGKGYVDHMGLGSTSEAIQRKAVAKARKKGADAVVIEDYFLLNNSTSISVQTDSARSTVGFGQTNPALSTNFNIFFIKYK